MVITYDARPGKTATIDDAGMIELIRKDDILLAYESRDRRQVGVKSGLKSDRGVDTLEGRHALL